MKSRRCPRYWPISAAPAIGTARNRLSSQKPAWSELAIADNHGT